MAAEIKIDIPDVLIADTIRSELVRNMTDENKDKFLTTLVRQAMDKKKDRYGTETVFAATMQAMIQEEVKKIYAEWIEQNRMAIRDALMKYLNANKQKQLTEFCTQLTDNITEYGISVRLDLRDRDR